ncbi:ankyrin repeat domain-containing protein [Dyadobacter psychrophilus]|uniref:Ankyrin repeat n=1 Tax=Dyadobacter psychrophilus TaxID=651661 RepID=A0A1T5E967_9BACT|nr:ankyrin repeat domain-containing protein [Dyadobacter psychrophilus]SKB80295.1 Ankyrin repeat [Dyadobacter psychrophilus]
MAENSKNTGAEDMQAAFIRAAIWHGSLTEADSMLALYPELAGMSIHTAAILGDAPVVRDFISADPTLIDSTAGPYGGNALVYCCMSKYLRLNKEKGTSFLETARILLDAGADPNSGFWTKGAYPEFETALYGAAGIAHHADLTKLLLAYGGDPNDIEAVYHSPETYENDAMITLVETGKITTENLVLMLIRKHDLHDYQGVKYLLEKGVDPNGRWSYTSPFHHALMRCNHIGIISLSLDYGADPALVCQDLSAAARAAREGRNDVLSELQKRGLTYRLEGVDRLIEACAFGDKTLAQNILQQDPSLLPDLMSIAGTLLAKFSGAGNVEGVRLLLDLGVTVDTPFEEGDGYFEIPKRSLAIHVAAWRAQHDVVQLLIERGSPIDIPDTKGRTPLQLAIKASVDSYWTDRRSPKSAEMLLNAGVKFDQALLPTGYEELDKLLLKFC